MSKIKYVTIPLSRAPFPPEFLDALNGFATGGSGRCREALMEEEAVLSAAPAGAGEAEGAWTEDMERERRQADYERGFRDDREAVAALTDPNTVHINMLRGGIAKPTPTQIGHLYRGTEATDVVREVIRQNPEALAALSPRPADREAVAFQPRVLLWLMECFGAEIAADRVERCDRFIEEALELAQSLDWPKERALALVDYVYGRPAGEPHQEVGGVMVTLAALCQAVGLDMKKGGDDELARIMQPDVVLKIRAKQAAKPTGSALPTALSRSSAPADPITAGYGADPLGGGMHKNPPQEGSK